MLGPSEMSDPRARQARFNADSQAQWEGFADHRRPVSALLGEGSPTGPTRLCVLGAGNGNDLDLPSLLKAHREVHLVDLDPDALARAADRQDVTGNPAIHLHGGLDLTGMLDAIGRWSPLASISDEDLQALVEWPSTRVGLALPGPFDRVASTCLLSQLIGNAHCSVGETHPRFADVVRAIRLGHLRLLSRLTAPGGTAVLITDVVSTRMCPELANVPEASLPGFLQDLTRERGLIYGVNPADLMSILRRDPVFASRSARFETIPPWRWKLHQRVYLVWAVRCRFEPSFGVRELAPAFDR